MKENLNDINKKNDKEKSIINETTYNYETRDEEKNKEYDMNLIENILNDSKNNEKENLNDDQNNVKSKSMQQEKILDNNSISIENLNQNNINDKSLNFVDYNDEITQKKMNFKQRLKLPDKIVEIMICHYCKNPNIFAYCIRCPISSDHIFCKDCVNSTFVSFCLF